jgi:ABC-type polar amino acid transport system ATPase subunit
MVKLIVGVKGTGKTKQLIAMVNDAINATKGSVVCIEKGNKLMHEVKYQARLIDTDEYLIFDAHALYGFVSGIAASNHDVTDIFIDSALKICENNIAEFEAFVDNLNKFTATHNINIVMTSSIPFEEVTPALDAFFVNK